MTSEAGVLDGLSTSFPDSVAYGHVILIATYTASAYAFVSGDISGDAISIVTDYAVGTRVKLTGLSDFDVNTVYFVTQVSPLKFSETLGGTDVPITSPADGTVTDVEPFLSGETTSTREIQTMADLVRYEVSDYLGVATRPVYTPPVAAIGTNQAGERAALLSFDDNFVALTNVSGAPDNPSDLSLDFSGFVLIKGGLPTPADTTGTVIFTNSFSALASVPAGSSFNLQFQISYPVYDITQNP